MKIKFLDCHILNFNKKYVLPFEQFPELTTHTQQVVSMFGTPYHCEQLFAKMNYAKCMLNSYHLSDVVLLSNSSFNTDITSFCDCKI